MPLAISNILWTPEQEGAALIAAKAAGTDGIEVAPSRIARWDALTPATAIAYRAKLADNGLTIPSMQALLFGVPDVALLADTASYQRLADHLTRVADIAAILGARVLVFGAPKQRLRGALDAPAANALAAERLRPIGDALHQRGVVLGIEPVPAAYGADFLHNVTEVATLVRQVNHPTIRLHLDTGALHLAGEDVSVVTANADILCHVHLSRQLLAPLTEALPLDAPLAAALQALPYHGWLSIEIGPQAEPLPVINKALPLARTLYGALLT